MPLTNLEAQLPALMVESVLYGLYLATFVACLQTLLQENGQWKRFKDINIGLLCVVVVLFIFSTLNLSCSLVQNMQGFVYHVGAKLEDFKKHKGNGIDQLGQSWLGITKLTLLGLQAILADSVLVYRCWLVWAKSILAILIPLICWLGSVACCIYAFYLQITLQEGSRLFTGELYWVIAAFWLCTILVNMYCTIMIVFRIWKAQRAWRPPSIISLSDLDLPQRGRLDFAKRIVIESALIYTTTSFVLFVTHLSRHNAVYIVSPAAIQVTGIAFNLILARTTDTERKRPAELPFYRQTLDVSRSTVDVAVMATTDAEDEEVTVESEEAYGFKPIAVNRLSR